MFRRLASFARISLVTIAVMLAVTAISVSPAMAQTPDVSMFGMCSHLMWGNTPAEVDRELDLMKAAGVAWVRTDISWRYFEPTDNNYGTATLASFDYLISAAASRGIKVLPVVMEFPSWANGGQGRWVPPTDDATFQDFMRFMAARYAGRITHWEIGNEVNLTAFWAVERSASPARYVKLLQKGYAGVKAGNPNAMVISAGLDGSDAVYLQEMYDAGAKGYFDLLGVHPYTGGRSPYASANIQSRYKIDGLTTMKATMERNGDATKNIWATEAGWQTSTVTDHVTEELQAQYIYEDYQRLHESFPYVETLFIYNLRNRGTDPTLPIHNYGLMTYDYTPKPAYAAYKRASEAFGPTISTPVVTPVEPTPTPIVTPVETTPTPVVTPVEPTPTPIVRPAKPRKSRTTIKTAMTTVRRRGSIVLSGRVTSSASALYGVAGASTVSTRARMRATLQRKLHGRWVNVKTITTRVTGYYKIRIKVRSQAIHRYRIRIATSRLYVGSTSRVVRVRVR